MCNELVSVIVPVYNGEKYLLETINALLKSTYSNLEILLINDGSKDNSLNICELLSSQDKRIKVYSQNNQGIVAARNKGLELASGKYICFCDQDDIVFPETYEKMYIAIKNNKVDCCICSTGKYINGEYIEFETYNNEMLDRNTILTKIIGPILFDGYSLSNIGLDFKNESRVSGCIWKCMISREVINNNGIRFKRFVNFEDDLLFLFDILCKCEKVVTLQYIGYYWRINSESETYRWKYIEDFYAKNMNYYLYLNKILSDFRISENIIFEFKKCFFCKVYVDLIDNECSPLNRKDMKERIVFLRDSIYTNSFDEIIDGRHKIEWGLLKRKIILMLINYKQIRCACCFNIMYRNIKKVAVGYKFWSAFEKKIRYMLRNKSK